jgi:hypothetical protein
MTNRGWAHHGWPPRPRPIVFTRITCSPLAYGLIFSDIKIRGADIYLDDNFGDSYDNEGLDQGQVRPKADEVESYDELIGATFLLDPLQNADNFATWETVKERRKDPFGNPIGKAHANSLLDTREYVVDVENGSEETYFANVIAENLWSQCDEEGREFSIFKEIVDHCTNCHAISIAWFYHTEWEIVPKEDNGKMGAHGGVHGR